MMRVAASIGGIFVVAACSAGHDGSGRFGGDFGGSAGSAGIAQMDGGAGSPAGGAGGEGFGGFAGSEPGVGGNAPGPGGFGGSVGGSGAMPGVGGAGGTGVPLDPAHLEVVDPTHGEVHVQVAGNPAQAHVDFAVIAGSAITAVEYVIENDFSLGVSMTPPSFALGYPYQYPGDRWAEARGYDAFGAHIATAVVEFVVAPPGAGPGPDAGPPDGGPSTGTCLGDLTAMGVPFSTTTAKGVVDAVHLEGPLDGVLFANGTSMNPTGDPIACEFVKQLHAFAGLLKNYDIVRVGTLGSYCYRCCCAWSTTNYCRGPNDPEPSCSSYSNHSWGRAIDVRYLYTSTGAQYDINSNSHWVQGSSSGTCTSGLAAQSGISRTLYEIACNASSQQIFSTILTPNYNSAHRNHWHMDIGQSGPPSGFVVRSLEPTGVDVAIHGDE